MGLFSFFRKKGLGGTIPPGANFNVLLGVSPQVRAAFMQAQAATYAYLYQHQPAVRTVIGYIADNASALPLKLYERVSDTERVESGDHPAAELLRNPREGVPGEQFIFDMVADFLIFDNAYVLKVRPRPGAAPRALVPLPAHAVGVIGNERYAVEGYRVHLADGSYFDEPPENVLHWRGYNPSDPRIGWSKLETLRKVLAVDAAAEQASVDLMESGLGQRGHIERPLEADASQAWSDDARQRFLEAWANQRKDLTKDAVLEEGMKFVPAQVSPKDAEMLEGRRFTREEVAHQYGMRTCPPESEEDRHQFYKDVLPGLTEKLTRYLDVQLLQADYAEDDLYFEFSLDEKQMSDDRLKALTSAAGRPVLTADEARAMLNLPAKEGGDELVVPLNVTLGGKPSVDVMPVQNPNGPSQDGDHREASVKPNGHSAESKAVLIERRASQARRRDADADEVAGAIRAHFSHQEQAYKSARGAAKAVNTAGQDQALADRLLPKMKKIARREGEVAAKRLGLNGFDGGQIENYLKAGALERARAINQATANALKEAKPAEVFDHAKNVRASEAGVHIATSLAAFGTFEAAKQDGTALRLKQWIATSGHDRHAAMNGETVSLYQPFSNGLEYPGDPAGGPEDNANCQCLMDLI